MTRMATPSTRAPHAVSKTVLRGWCDSNGQLARFSILTGGSEPRGPDGMGQARGLVLDSSPEFEHAWSRFENAWPQTRAAIEGGRAFSDPTVAEILRDCVATHMARSRDLIALHHGVWVNAATETAAALIAARRDSASPEPNEAIRSWVDKQVAEVAASSFTAESMIEAYADARELVARGGIEIVIADEGEFLISDAPALSLKAGVNGVGPLEGISWRAASTVVMPLGRRHAVAFGPADDEIHLDRDQVDHLNRHQVRSAHEYVAWHPDVDMRAFAEAERLKRTGPRAPRFPPGISFDASSTDPP
jgi:hypothetical protein